MSLSLALGMGRAFLKREKWEERMERGRRKPGERQEREQRWDGKHGEEDTGEGGVHTEKGTQLQEQPLCPSPHQAANKDELHVLGSCMGSPIAAACPPSPFPG